MQVAIDKDLEEAGWRLEAGFLHKEFQFHDFKEAFSFMTSVALLSEQLDHHPDWSNSYNRVVIDLISHDQNQVTSRDIHFARKIETYIR